MTRRVETGIAHWLRVAEWLRQQRGLLDMTPMDAANAVRGRFNVSRATAYRYLAAWREVSADQRGQQT